MIRHITLLVLLALASCAPYVATSTGSVTVNGNMTVEVPRAWNKVAMNAASDTVEIWTSEGLGLDSLFLAAGLKDGQPLFGKVKSDSDRQPPLFRKDMTPADVAELFESSMSVAGGGVPVTVTGLAPIQFAGFRGFRFDYSFSGRTDRLDRKGFGAGAINDGKLYLVFFHGSRIYHYEKYRLEVEAMIRSAGIPSAKKEAMPAPGPGAVPVAAVATASPPPPVSPKAAATTTAPTQAVASPSETRGLAAVPQAASLEGNYITRVRTSTGRLMDLQLKVEGSRLSAWGDGQTVIGSPIVCRLETDLDDDGRSSRAALDCFAESSTYAVHLDSAGGFFTDQNGNRFPVRRR
jgi:hypothetical protein